MLDNYNLKNYTKAELITSQYHSMMRVNLYKNDEPIVCAVFGISKFDELHELLRKEFVNWQYDGATEIITFYREPHEI